MTTNVVRGTKSTIAISASLTNGSSASAALDIQGLAGNIEDVVMSVRWSGGAAAGSVTIHAQTGFDATDVQTGLDGGRINVLYEPTDVGTSTYQTRQFSARGLMPGGGLPGRVVIHVDNDSAATITSVDLVYETQATEDNP